MSAKNMKALRKALKYKPRNKREYETHLLPTTGLVAQINEDGTVEVVEKIVDKQVIECVSGDRKVYQFMKKKLHNIDHEETLNELPSKQELNELTKDILSGKMEETHE